MPFTVLTAPSAGDPTKKQAFAEGVINDLNYLNGQLGTVVSAVPTAVNGSFETDTDADGIPDGWTRTLLTGGASAHETTAANVRHGSKSFKFTAPGGAGNGGGYLESTDFIAVTEAADYWIGYWLKCSGATVSVASEVRFYDVTQSFISSVTIYTATSGNPTSYAYKAAKATSPANARFCKIRITGGSTDSVAGDIWFDGVEFFFPMIYGKMEIFDSAGSSNWTPPPRCVSVEVEMIGGGGGGGFGGGSSGGGGGGGGEYVRYSIPVTPFNATAYTVGAGGAGAGSSGNNGATGGSSQFSSGSFPAAGGVGGAFGSGGTPGAGGAGGGTDAISSTGIKQKGSTGATGTGSVGGSGANPRFYTSSTVAVGDAGTGDNATFLGGGGAGGGPAVAGGNGAAGRVIIHY